jgi:hypothetical protein
MFMVPKTENLALSDFCIFKDQNTVAYRPVAER